MYLPIEKLEERLDGAMPCHNYNVSWIFCKSRACPNQLQVKLNILYIPFRVMGMHQLVVGNWQELNLLRNYEDKSSILSTNHHKAPSYIYWSSKIYISKTRCVSSFSLSHKVPVLYAEVGMSDTMNIKQWHAWRSRPTIATISRVQTISLSWPTTSPEEPSKLDVTTTGQLKIKNSMCLK